MAPSEVAPGQDGLVAPAYSDPAWLADHTIAHLSAGELLAAEREANLGHQANVAVSEGKATRLLTPIIALLTGAATLIAFELSTASGRDGWRAVVAYSGAAFGAWAALLLVVAAVRALDADTRVGLFNHASPVQRVAPDLEAVRAEAQGSALAEWTSRNKASRVMEARSALSRALLLLVLSLLAGAVTVVAG